MQLNRFVVVVPLMGLFALWMSCSDKGGNINGTDGSIDGSVDIDGSTDGSTTTGGPELTDVSGTVSHGQSVIITGLDFGTKDPAAPFMWDDCEDRTVDDPANVLDKGWADPWPRMGGVVSHRIQYRDVDFRSTLGPHPRSTKYMAGGHYQYPNNDPPYIGQTSEDYRNVSVTVDAILGQPRWFALFYYRLDPLWRDTCPPMNNHKTSVVQSGGAAYTPGQGFSYIVYRAQAPCGDEQRFNYHGFQNCDVGVYPDDFPDTNNPRLQWVHYEERIADDDELGFRNLYIDNRVGLFFQANCPNWFNGQGGSYGPGIRSYSIGGYYRWATDINDTATYRGDENHFRYFDDIYIDNTLARVMLADHADYNQATVTEPQIPSAWTDTSITVTVNLGQLPDTGTAYLFVFDSDNNHNAAGYPVTLGQP